MQRETMAPAAGKNMAHQDVPGNPSTASSSKVKLRKRIGDQPLRVLSEADWKFWITNGYVVIKNAVPREQALKTAAFLWEFERKNPDDPESWYTAPLSEMKMKELVNTGMIEVY